jgi:hypothetical protein
MKVPRNNGIDASASPKVSWTAAAPRVQQIKRGRQLRRPYCNFGGCSSPLIQACTSDNRIGSTPSHWTHWNLRRPVSNTMKCIGLLHFGQGGGVGGGRFSATTLTLYSGASITELTVAG